MGTRVTPSAIHFADKTLAGVPRLLDDLQRLLDDRESADIVFIVGREEAPIYAHRLILRARCTSFQNVKRGEICKVPGSSVSPAPPGTPTPIRLPHAKPDVFREVLFYIYSGKVILQDCSVFECLSIAQELGIDELRICCEDHINSTLNVHNACTFLPAALQMENRVPVIMMLMLEHGNSVKRIVVDENVTMDSLLETICERFEIEQNNIKLEIYDSEFGVFSDLDFIEEVKHLSRLKITIMEEPSIDLQTESSVNEETIKTKSTLRKSNWKDIEEFKVNTSNFCEVSRQELANAKEAYEIEGKFHKPSYKLKKEILDILSKQLTNCGLYPSTTIYHDLTNTFLASFPYLRDPIGGGNRGLKIALKYRMQEIRRKLKNNETSINSVIMVLMLEHGNSVKRIVVDETVTMDSLLETICERFEIEQNNIKLEIYDSEFAVFSDLDFIEEVKHLSRLKITIMEEPSIDLQTESSVNEETIKAKSTLRKSNWKDIEEFKVNTSNFCEVSRQELANAKEAYEIEGKFHKASYKLKKEILNILSKQLTNCGLYPSNTIYHDLTNTFLASFPYLRDPVGGGNRGLKIALKYRMQEIRRKLKNNETSINSGKRCKSDTNLPPANKNIKKACRGEVNYAPELPVGETFSTLTEHKKALLMEWAKPQPNMSTIDEKMHLTFPLRRQEIVYVKNVKSVAKIKQNWPMLFTPNQLSQELTRILGTDTHQTFLDNIQSGGLKKVMAKKTKKDQLTSEEMLQHIPKVFKDKWPFFCKQENITEQQEETKMPTQNAFIVSIAEEWGIIAEEMLLVEHLDFTSAVWCLLCIYYALDLEYPQSGIKSFVFLQEGLAEIPYGKKIPQSVFKMLNEMKLYLYM